MRSCPFRYIWLNTRVFCIILPSDKSATRHFYQFGELTAERRFLFANLDYTEIRREYMSTDH